MPEEWRVVELTEVLSEASHRVDVSETVEYPMAGVYSFGRGLFHREALHGSKTSYKKLHRLRQGQFVLSKLKAWEGAVAVAGPEFDGCHLSPEFPLFDINEQAVDSGYLSLMCSTDRFWERLQQKSRGMGGRRERVHPSQLLSVKIELPPLNVQARIVDLISSIDEAIEAIRLVEWNLATALATIREEAARTMQQASVPLAKAATIRAKLVDPTEPKYRDLPHIGVAQIEKGTGRILPWQSAAEEKVTSSKYLFTENDVVYAKIRPNLRKVAVPGFTGLASADAYPLRPKEGVPPIFLQQMLLSRQFSAAATARSARTKMPKINRKQLFSIEIPFGDADSRRRFSEVAGSLLAAQEAARAERSALDATRSAILSALLSGSATIPDSYDRLIEEAS